MTFTNISYQEGLFRRPLSCIGKCQNAEAFATARSNLLTSFLGLFFLARGHIRLQWQCVLQSISAISSAGSHKPVDSNASSACSNNSCCAHCLSSNRIDRKLCTKIRQWSVQFGYGMYMKGKLLLLIVVALTCRRAENRFMMELLSGFLRVGGNTERHTCNTCK